MRLLTITAALLLLLAIPMLSASAAPPSPTPTLKPIPPTATSVYIYLRPTPTRLTLNSSSIQVTWIVGSNAGELADTTINVYRAANQDHMIDFLVYILMAGVAVGYLVRLAGKTTQDKG